MKDNDSGPESPEMNIGGESLNPFSESSLAVNTSFSRQLESTAALIAGDLRFRSLLDNLNEVIYEVDGGGIIRYINTAIEKLTGFTPSEMIGKSIVGFIGEMNVLLNSQQNVPRDNKELVGEYRISGKKGGERWIRFSMKTKLENGVFAGGSGTIIDITEKKNAENELLKNEEKYRLLAENISDVIWVYNITQHKFIYMSPSVYNLRGVSIVEAKSRRLEDDLSAESVKVIHERISSTINKFKAEPTKIVYYLDEVQIRKKDGSLIWIETNSHYNLAANGDIEIIGVSRNIETRKQSELYLQKYAEELEISEEKFYSIFNNSPVSMVISDPKSLLIMDANEVMVNTIGLNKKDIIGKKLEELGFDIKGIWYEEIIRQMSQGKSIRNFESSIVIRSGVVVEFLVSVDYIRIKGYEYFLITAVDITQIKKNEQRIKHFNSHQKLIADISQIINRPTFFSGALLEVLTKIGEHTGASRVCIFEDSQDGKVTKKTNEWCNTGIVPQSSQTEIPYDFVPSWKELLGTEGRIFSENVRELPMDILLFLEAQNIKSILVYPLFVENKPMGFISFDECEKSRTWNSDDIDLLRTASNIISNAFARKQMIDRLESSELRLKLAIESANEGLWDWNILTGEIFFNEIWCNLMGCHPDESRTLVSNWENRVYPPDKQKVTNALDAHLRGETEYYEAVYRVNSKDGKLKWLLEHGMVVDRDDRGEPLRAIGMIIDISGQKEIEKLLKESVENQQKLFSIIAHDLRGPLGNFVQVLELITNGRDLDEEMKNMFLEELKTASGTTFTLLENLLNWSRSQTNTIKIEPAEQNILKILSENAELMRITAGTKDIDLTVEADKELIAIFDINSINLVIRNLLSNAIKFTNRKGQIRVSACDNGKNIEIIIADNGIGMDQCTVDNLFRLGSFHSTFGTEREKGSGLGLLLCKDFVERNGGEIFVESKKTEGTKFVFTLLKSR